MQEPFRAVCETRRIMTVPEAGKDLLFNKQDSGNGMNLKLIEDLYAGTLERGLAQLFGKIAGVLFLRRLAINELMPINQSTSRRERVQQTNVPMRG